MEIIKTYITKNDCYIKNLRKPGTNYIKFQTKGPQGLMLHSVGTPQPRGTVFVRNWDKPGVSVAVHAVLQADGTVYQCLPWNYRGWHAGGAANNTHIGVEMTEPDCIKYTKGSNFICSDVAVARRQVEGTYIAAVELFAFLCEKYHLDPMTDIISHKEGHKLGIASNHGDPEHLWKQLKLGYTMNTFRRDVQNHMQAKLPYIVRITADKLNVRKGPGTGYAIRQQVEKGEAFTITEVKYGWGKLKSGAGWISLKYTELVD